MGKKGDFYLKFPKNSSKKDSGMTIIELMVGIALFSIFIGFLYQAVRISSDTYHLGVNLNQFTNKLDSAIKRIETLAAAEGVGDWTSPAVSGEIDAIKIGSYWYGVEDNSLVRAENSNLKKKAKHLIRCDGTPSNQFEIKKFSFFLYDSDGKEILDKNGKAAYLRLDIEADNFFVEKDENRQIGLSFSSGIDI